MNFFSKNWESDIRGVRLEACPRDEDPLGYRAVFLHGPERASFAVGASYLIQRATSLAKAGYRAPMTQKAISLLEGRLGRAGALAT